MDFVAPHHSSSSVTALLRLSEPHSYKNRLQEFVQRSSIAILMYQTVNEGSDHAPMFRATVWVNGMGYISQTLFLNGNLLNKMLQELLWSTRVYKLKMKGALLFMRFVAYDS
ncbi:Double-stranded RNA-binding domain [Sesbania bispinosa]|nr:Double-stranded RNA-binding domain [Sesbania bispinosa]KAJ1378010.1 Double-stranded RNA-binding domain [Sesbania bispinosa]